MEFYRCKTEGILSLTNQEPCPLCHGTNWETVDSKQLDTEDWKAMYGLADTAEKEFQVIDAWAETGNPEAIRMRAMLLKNGTGCKQDTKRAIEDLTCQAEKKDRDAMFLLGCCYVAGDAVSADPVKGLSMLWQSRDMKCPEAAWALATMYSSGSYVIQDKKKAMKLFKQAAEMGSEMGMYEYGLRLFSSAKNEKEAELGLSWLWRSARSECGEAQAALGFILGQSSSPVQDVDQSLYWLNRAVDNEVDGAAAAYASVWYEDNGGFSVDDEECSEIIQMLEDALNRGESSAAHMLGDFCRKGIGQPQNFDKAFKYYRMGQGRDINCTAGAAHCYLYGLGVEKNPSMAHLMLSDFIEIGKDHCKTSLPESALLDLGDMYRDGNGAKKDLQIAAMIYGAAKDSIRAKGRLCREFLTGNPTVSGLTTEQALDMLDWACEEGDFDSAFFLTNYYINIGDREKAAVYMNEALHAESEHLDKPATKLAEQKFPDVLEGFCSDADLVDRADQRRQPVSETGLSSKPGLSYP